MPTLLGEGYGAYRTRPLAFILSFGLNGLIGILLNGTRLHLTLCVVARKAFCWIGSGLRRQTQGSIHAFG